jgi:hypothetical protein
VSVSEKGGWAIVAIDLWHSDTALQSEFDSVAQFNEWMQTVAETLIRSAEDGGVND